MRPARPATMNSATSSNLLPRGSTNFMTLPAALQSFIVYSTRMRPMAWTRRGCRKCLRVTRHWRTQSVRKLLI